MSEFWFRKVTSATKFSFVAIDRPKLNRKANNPISVRVFFGLDKVIRSPRRLTRNKMHDFPLGSAALMGARKYTTKHPDPFH